MKVDLTKSVKENVALLINEANPTLNPPLTPDMFNIVSISNPKSKLKWPAQSVWAISTT